MKIKNSVILSLVSMVFSTLLQAQELRDKWVLDTVITGTKTYVAWESVSLLAGFKYSSSAGSTFTATVDPIVLNPPTENTYLKPDGTITTDPALGGVVGALSGSFDVSPTGAAIYSVPIEVLPGIQGMSPNLSLIIIASRATEWSGCAGVWAGDRCQQQFYRLHLHFRRNLFVRLL